MKRRLEINTRDPPFIRSSSVRGFNRVRSNVENKDVIRAKRAKFMDPESDSQPNIRPDADVGQHEPAGDPASHAPKTSEYAFFKKLKKDAGCCRSYTSHNEEKLSKDSEPSGGSRGISTKFKDIRDNLRSSLHVEKVRPVTHNLFSSPHSNASTNSANAEQANIVDGNIHKDTMSPLSVEKVKPNNHSLLLSPPGGTLKNSGTEYLDEIFSGKRKRLRQWVAKTLLPEAEELCSEGCDLVSVLINRLCTDPDYLPHARLKNSDCQPCRDAKPMQMRADTNYSSRAFLELDTYDKEFHWTPKRDMLEPPKHGWDLDDFCCRSRELVPLKWDTKCSDSPSASHASKDHSQCENKKFSCDYDCGTANLIPINDQYFCSNLENYVSVASTHIKGLSGFQDLDESVDVKGPCTLLLGWDFDSLKEQGVSRISTCNAEMSLNSTSAASWDDHQQSLDNSFDASEFYSSFFFSYPSKFTSLPHAHSARDYELNVGGFLEDEKFLFEELKHLPLSLPCTPKYLNLREYCHTYNTCEGSRTISPENHRWVISKVFSEKHCPSGLGFDLGSRCLSMSGVFSSTHDGPQSPLKESPCSYFLTEEQHEDCFYSSNHRQNITHFAEDAIESHEWSSINFKIPMDIEIARPLLLDSSSWLTTEEDILYCDDERIYI